MFWKIKATKITSEYTLTISGYKLIGKIIDNVVWNFDDVLALGFGVCHLKVPN